MTHVTSPWQPVLLAELAVDSMKNIALSLDCIKEKTIHCSLHGAVFDLADGRSCGRTIWQTRVIAGTVEVLLEEEIA